MSRSYKIYTYAVALLAFGALSASFSCMQRSGVKSSSPAGYNLSKPQKYEAPAGLTEISGIALYQGNANRFFAHDDELGRVYRFRLGDKTAPHTKFAGHGDYEDIAICHQKVIMLRSDGVFYVFDYAALNSAEATNVQKLEKLLPKGEYEGLYTDEQSGKVYALCKNCSVDKKGKTTSGYIFDLKSNGTLVPSGNFEIDNIEIAALAGDKKVHFKPSALARRTASNEWYVLSSVNKMLVVTDARWKVKGVYALSASSFPQPEGITFDKENNLYISNEGGLSKGTILKFAYNKGER